MFIFLLPDFQKQEIPHLLFRDIIDRMEFRGGTASIILLMEGVSPFATERLDMYVPFSYLSTSMLTNMLTNLEISK